MISVPPLLLLAAGGKPRPRKLKVTPPKESKLQTDVANLLRDHLLPDWRATHFPAGESRGRGLDAIITGTRLKRYGLKRGWPDVQLVSPAGIYHGLELKRIGEELSDDEEGFREWSLEHGVPYATAQTMGEVLEALYCWKCLRVKEQS